MKFKSKKTTIVRKHTRRVPVGKKNPTGITAVTQHVRHIQGISLTIKEINKIAEEYKKDTLIYPKSDDLSRKDGNSYDGLIAIWVDYFNKKFVKVPLAPLDPDIVKALIGSESDFKKDPKNPQAIGIAQIIHCRIRMAK